MAHSVCTSERAWMLDTPLRSLLIRPNSLLSPYVKPGMKVLDIGCGPGFFVIPLAKMVGPRGRVVAADLQPEMLDMAGRKVAGNGYSDRVVLHRAMADSLHLTGDNTFDLAIAFHVVHEVPDPLHLFREVYDLVKPGGLFLVSEPKGHVRREEFQDELGSARKAGFKVVQNKSGLMEHQVLFQRP